MTRIEELQSLLDRMKELQADLVSYANREERPLRRCILQEAASDLTGVRNRFLPVLPEKE